MPNPSLIGPDKSNAPRYFVPGDDLECTGIPALQNLCKELADRTESLEIASFLRRLREFLTVIDSHLTAYTQKGEALMEFHKLWKTHSIQ